MDRIGFGFSQLVLDSSAHLKIIFKEFSRLTRPLRNSSQGLDDDLEIALGVTWCFRNSSEGLCRILEIALGVLEIVLKVCEEF